MASTRILVVEDQPAAAELVSGFLGQEGLAVDCAGSAAEAWDRASKQRYDLVLLDLGLPDEPGQDLLERFRRSRPWLPVIVSTGALEAETAIHCLEAGAVDYLTKPHNLPVLLSAVRRELDRARLQRRLRSLNEQASARGVGRLLGASQPMRELREQLARVAKVDIGVLLVGETGTGKDLAARALHEDSPRAERPMVSLDCGALPERLIESELFGHERGAFTGADGARKGRLEMAQKGTLFLDEVGELPLGSQAKLLRALQDRKVRRVGGKAEIPIDVRVIAATNSDLGEARKQGRFREDLYHRLAEISITLPPLRQRREDVPMLALALLQSAAELFEKPVEGFDPQALAALQAHAWPGNVRELLHTIRQALVSCGPRIELAQLPVALRGDAAGEQDLPALETAVGSALQQAENVMLRRALEAARWNRKDAADLLGVDAKTLYNKMKSHGID